MGSVDEREYWSQIFQEVALAPGEPVYANLYAKSTFLPVATASAGIMLQFMDDEDNV